MSLQVWLPLNGNLNNQGLADVTVTEVNGASTFAAGKIGQGLSCNGSKNCRITGATLGTEASICCWSKTTVSGKMMWVLDCAVSNYLNVYTNSIYTLNIGDSNQNPFKDDFGNNISVLSDGLWHHFVVTFDGTKAKLYIDGTYRGTAQTYRSPQFNSSHKTIKLAGDYGGGHSYDWNGMLNDFRVYDHCLSPKEVKEISQGLVLHYKLDDPYVEGTMNLLTNQNITFVNLGAQTSYTKTGDVYIVNIGDHTSSNSALQSRMFVPLEILINGTQYTLSFKYKTISGNGKININACDWCDRPKISQSETNYDEYYYVQFVCRARDTYDNTFHFFDIQWTDINSSIKMWDFQLEAKDHATPYVNGTRNQTTVCDTSGYGNNGTITGTLSVTNDSPRYNLSTQFGNSKYISPLLWPSFLTNECTVSMWIYLDQLPPSSPGRTMLYTAWFGFSCEITSAGKTYFRVHLIDSDHDTPRGTITTGEWIHWVGVKSSTGISLYLDGVLIGTTSNTNDFYWQSVNSNKIAAHSSSYFLYGKMSDLRLYSTALSVDDIKELYNTSAYIDNGQNLHCYEFTEDDVTSPEIEKTGIVKTQEFNEFPDDIVLYDYIESTGTQYIDTNFNPNNNTRVVTEFMPISDDNGKGFFGAYPSNNFSTATYGLYYSSSSGNAYSNYQSDTVFNRNTYLLHDVKHKVDKNKNLLYIDNNLVLTHTAATFQSSISMHVFKLNFTSNPRYAKMKLYYFKIYDNDVLVRDYLPCTKNGEAGLWDRVNNQFYGNAGTGTFTLGNPIQTVTSLYQDKINTKQMIEL